MAEQFSNLITEGREKLVELEKYLLRRLFQLEKDIQQQLTQYFNERLQAIEDEDQKTILEDYLVGAKRHITTEEFINLESAINSFRKNSSAYQNLLRRYEILEDALSSKRITEAPGDEKFLSVITTIAEYGDMITIKELSQATQLRKDEVEAIVFRLMLKGFLTKTGENLYFITKKCLDYIIQMDGKEEYTQTAETLVLTLLQMPGQESDLTTLKLIIPSLSDRVLEYLQNRGIIRMVDKKVRPTKLASVYVQG